MTQVKLFFGMVLFIGSSAALAADSAALLSKNSIVVTGSGFANYKAAAEYGATLDAKTQCLNVTGSDKIKQVSAFSDEIVRPGDVGHFYHQVSADFQCL